MTKVVIRYKDHLVVMCTDTYIIQYGYADLTLLLPNVMELEAFSLYCFTKAPNGPPWD